MRRILLSILAFLAAGPNSSWAAGDVCSQLATQVAEGQLGALRASDLSAPHDSPSREEVMALIGADAYASHFFDQHSIERLRLDMDGDGQRDHVFLQIVGSEHCPRLTIFSGGKQTSFLASAGSESWCGWTPFFLQQGGVAHLVADDPSGTLDVARLIPGQGFQRQCTVSVAWSGAPEIDSSACLDPLCTAAANAAGAVLHNPLSLSSGRPGRLDFIRNGTLYRTDGGVYVDIDNDGFEDYVKPGRGAQNQLYWEFYAKDGGTTFHDVDPAQRWAGFEQLTTSRQWLPFFDGEKLDIIRAAGRNLLLGINKDNAAGSFLDRRAYRETVWILENGALRNLGSLLATDRPSVRIDPCRDGCALPDE